MTTLHELVHCSDSIQLDLELSKFLYCLQDIGRRQEGMSLERVYERGEIFDITMYGAVVGGNEQTLRSCFSINLCANSFSVFSIFPSNNYQTCV